MRNFILSVLIVCALVVTARIMSPVAFAAGPFVQCGNQDGGTPAQGCQIVDLLSTVARMINYLFAGAGVIAVGGVVYGGFLMVTSGGNESRLGQGKKAIVNSLIGLAIVLLSILIVTAVLKLLQYQGDANNIITNPAGSFQSGGANVTQ